MIAALITGKVRSSGRSINKLIFKIKLLEQVHQVQRCLKLSLVLKVSFYLRNKLKFYRIYNWIRFREFEHWSASYEIHFTNWCHYEYGWYCAPRRSDLEIFFLVNKKALILKYSSFFFRSGCNHNRSDVFSQFIICWLFNDIFDRWKLALIRFYCTGLKRFKKNSRLNFENS